MLFFIALIALALVGAAGTVASVVRDGYAPVDRFTAGDRVSTAALR